MVNQAHLLLVVPLATLAFPLSDSRRNELFCCLFRDIIFTSSPESTYGNDTKATQILYATLQQQSLQLSLKYILGYLFATSLVIAINTPRQTTKWYKKK